jgi:uncharacterized protein (TIGR00730 family)
MDERMKTVTIFGSAVCRPGVPDYERAVALGRGLAERGCAICNGGYGGTMEAAARGARACGGAVTGVTLRGAGRPANEWTTEHVEAPDLLERIDTLIRRGDGFVVLPGGTGTLAEIGVLLEYMNKGVIERRPAVFLGSHWAPLLGIVRDERLLAEGAVSVAAEPAEAVERICEALEGGG